MRKKIVFLLAFLCMLLLAGCSNGKETSKYNIEYLNKIKPGLPRCLMMRPQQRQMR